MRNVFLSEFMKYTILVCLVDTVEVDMFLLARDGNIKENLLKTLDD
ncbi:MAG: hypothetical protein PHE29_10135 [Tissierellia bacterium]|nr:hypothetical protein [Tissierellia bacterium]